jgi:hypothetical protein
VAALAVLLPSAIGLGGPWAQEAELLPEFGFEGGELGTSVGIHGDWVVLGAPQQISAIFPGSVYLYQRTTDGWVESTQLTASDAKAADLFGGSVAISEDRIIVGAINNPFFDEDPGAAYVFERSRKGSWREVAKLTASDEATADRFGWSVDLGGKDLAIVGARGQVENTGAAYIYEQNELSWTETKLTAGDAAFGDAFGSAVAVFDDVAVVGASGEDEMRGAAYIFEQTEDGWIESAKLTSFFSPPGGDGGLLPPLFGSSTAVHGDRVIIGSSGEDGKGLDTGAAYIFERTDQGWTEAIRLIPEDVEPGDRFGWSVDIWDDRAIVGSREANDGAGAAYVYQLLDDDWTEVAKMTGTSGGPIEFGYAVDIDAERAAVGAPKDWQNGDLAGTAYVYVALPEPSTLVLGLVGLVAMLLGRPATRGLRGGQAGMLG